MGMSYSQCIHCHKLYPKHERSEHPCYEGEVSARPAHYIQPDIQPYQAMAFDQATGKAPVITSRREHREFLRRNGYQEIGNETPKVVRQQADHNVRKELTEATREVLAKYR